MFKLITYNIEGLTPLIMHNGRTADPLDEYARKLKQITSKRAKTDEHHEAMAQLEYEAGLYYDPDFPKAGLYMPQENLIACLIKGAKRLKMGPKISAIGCVADVGYAIDTGHKSIAEVKADKQTWLRKAVTVGTSKVMRTRPCFKSWRIENVVFELDPSLLNVEELDQIILVAGKSVGLGDWRPGSKSPGPYGKFAAKRIKVETLE